jgi:hypothetical protein
MVADPATATIAIRAAPTYGKSLRKRLVGLVSPMRAGEAVKESSAREAPMFVFVIDVASRKAKNQLNTATVERNPYLRLETGEI